MEMLVIIAIIAILAGVLLPVLTCELARASDSLHPQPRQLYVAYTLYERDWNGRFPPWHNLWTSAGAAVPDTCRSPAPRAEYLCGQPRHLVLQERRV